MKVLLICVALLFATSSNLVGQESTAGAGPGADEEVAKANDRDQRLAAYLTGSKFIGQFTILGKENGKMPKEEYTLRSVTKIPGGDLFLITARIKYGDKDVEVPMPIPIQWAGKTPMISLDDFTIPGMGTFSAKIVINKGRYAGTWSHDENGGHMFGVIEKEEDASEDKPADQPKPAK